MTRSKLRSKSLQVPVDSDIISTNGISENTILPSPRKKSNCETSCTANDIILNYQTMSPNRKLSVNSQKSTKQVCSKKRPWLRFEDNLLKKLIKKMGAKNWMQIS